MFQDAAQLDAQRTARTLRSALTDYFGSREAWYNGTLESIDARQRECSRLYSIASSASGRFRLANASEAMMVAHRLGEDRRTLWAMRDTLLHETADQQGDGRSPVGRRSSTTRLSAGDQYLVNLEAQKFVAHQAGTYGNDLHELRTRAQQHIADLTSTATRQRARKVAAVFVDKVEELGRLIPRTRTAATRHHYEDFDDQLLFD